MAKIPRGYVLLSRLCRQCNVPEQVGYESVKAMGLDAPEEGRWVLIRAADVSAVVETLEATRQARLIVSRRVNSVRLPEVVYFVQCQEFVKIGVAWDVPGRLRDLQTGSPYPLTLLFTVAGGYDVESELHSRFHSYRHSGEWFRIEGKLKDYLENGCKVRDGESHQTSHQRALFEMTLDAMQQMAEDNQRVTGGRDF